MARLIMVVLRTPFFVNIAPTDESVREVSDKGLATASPSLGLNRLSSRDCLTVEAAEAAAVELWRRVGRHEC